MRPGLQSPATGNNSLMRRISPLFGGRRDRAGGVRVYGCSPGCLLASLAVSLLLTIALNLLIRLF